jgi:hypothetical protein
VDKYRRVDDQAFTMTKNARLGDIVAYIGQESLPSIHDKQKLHHATK